MKKEKSIVHKILRVLVAPKNGFSSYEAVVMKGMNISTLDFYQVIMLNYFHFRCKLH